MSSHRPSAALSPEAFVRNLGDSGLFRPAELSRILAQAPAAADSQVLAGHLVGAGHLSAFQARALLDGRLGELRIGNYDVLERLGSGGMGTVYKARHRRMKRIVALKVLTPDPAHAEEFTSRFQREIEIISGLSHPNIVMAFDADEADAGPFLVMEYVEGRDLACEVQQNGPLSCAAAVDAVLQAARGLEYAHAQGIVHRDVKPANLLRNTAGIVKVADLGLARLSRPSGEPTLLTQVGNLVGTLAFIPPEQALDPTHTDPRADVYSLGCTLHYLLTGRPPYEAPSLMALLVKHTAGSIPSLCEARPDVPVELDRVFQRMVAKTPEERYASMSEVLEALGGLKDLPTSPAVPAAARKEDSFVLPQPGPEAPLVDTKITPPPSPSGAVRTVVVAEPSRTQARIIRDYFLQLGAETVRIAGTGQAALALAGQVRPQVVLSAMHLSDMTGVQLERALRQEWPGKDTAFILMTSEADSGPPAGAAAAEHPVLMHKPFDRRALAKALAQALARTPGPRRVLIVDDSAAARANVRDVLRGLGLQHFREVADAADALDWLRDEVFDLVVTDYHMPRMDGLALTRFIRSQALAPAVPILLSTTDADPAVRERALQAGVSAVCDKRFQAEEVRALLARLL